MELSEKFKLAAQNVINKFSVGSCTITKLSITYSTTSGTVSSTTTATVSVPHVVDGDITKYEKNKNFIGSSAAVLVSGLDLGTSKSLADVGNQVTLSTGTWKILAKEVDMYDALFILGVTKV